MLQNQDITERSDTLTESRHFFLWTGLILLFGFLRGILRAAVMTIVPFSGQTLSLIGYASSFLGILEMLGILITCIVCRSKAFRAGEMTGRKLCGLWTLLLFIDYAVGLLLPRIVLAVMGPAVTGSIAQFAILLPHLIRCLLIAAGLFISGILTGSLLWKILSLPIFLLIPLAVVLSRFTFEIPLNGFQAAMSVTPATMALTALPAAVMLLIRAFAKEK